MSARLAAAAAAVALVAALRARTRPQWDASEWAYLAEGGANVVFAYRGRRRRFCGRVLRAAKRAPGASLAHRLPARLAVPCERVAVPSAFLAQLDADLRRHPGRPEKRCGDALAPGCDALLLEDACARPGVCVEIKPKAGTPPPPGRLCRYCAHQRLRGATRAPQRYCPLDLYSDCEERQLRALAALQTAPRNNVRVWVDGERAPAEALPARAVAAALRASGVFGELRRLQSGSRMTPAEALALGAGGAGVDAFLEVATFRDCSIMVTLVPGQPARVRVVDVDVKPASKLEYYVALEGELESVSSAGICVGSCAGSCAGSCVGSGS